jgi:hypothetical protein
MSGEGLPICAAMPISRPILLALLGAALLGVSFFALRNALDRVSGESKPAAQTQQPSSRSEQAGQGSEPEGRVTPNEALRSAFSFDRLRSARFDGSLSLKTRGARPQSARVEISGKFQGGAKGEIPRFDVDVKLRALDQRLNAGFVSLGDRAYFTRGEVGYEIPRAVWSKVVDAARDGGRGGSPSLRLPFDPRSWLRDVKSQRAERINGVDTVHVSASVDPARALRDVLRAAAQSGQTPGALPPQLVNMVARAVKRAELDVFVGAEDRILRRVTLDLELALPAQLQTSPGVRGATIALAFNLSDVNRPQAVERPERVSRRAPGGAFGQFIQSFSRGIALATGTRPGVLSPPTNDNPRRLRSAVRNHRKVVLFFYQPRALDDQATAEAVRALGGGVLVLRDTVKNAARYGSLVQELGVSQAPSIVLVDRRGQARLLEGYIDARALAQAVADAR